MRRKSNKTGRLRLSPNEEAQLVKEELDRRRRLRLQQVREQERCIAQQVRRDVQERREKQLQILADTLHDEWQEKHTDKLQTLVRSYEESLQSIGHAHRSARQNEPDLEALAQRTTERQERAGDRHRAALRELTARRHEAEEQRVRHIEARRNALLEEKKRALKMASLPPPPPKPLESIEVKSRLPLKSATSPFSVTHHHMQGTAVDRETDTEQMDAREAARKEEQRLEELQQEKSRDRLEKLEKARLRGNHSLKKEQDTQDRTRLLGELQRLQQADLLRRRQAVNRIPSQIFQPLYRQEELRDEQQRDLEIAFHNMYTEERKVRGDLVLQLVPEPLPHPSADSHDEDLDVTLDPEGEADTVTETLESSSLTSEDPSRHALRRLLDRIRNQRDQARLQRTTAVEAEGNDVQEVLSIETGSLSDRERELVGSTEEQTPSVTQSDEGAEVSDEPIVAGTVPLPEEEAHVTSTSAESERTKCFNQQFDEGGLLRQQREQLILLEELEKKRQELEQRLKEAQQMLEDAAHVHSGIEEVQPLPEPAPKVVTGDVHTQRLYRYQQRLLEQNRLHKKCVEDARHRLEEYQRTLKLRHAINTAAQTLQPSAVSFLHPPNNRTHDHRSVLAKSDVVIISTEEQPKDDACQTHAQPIFSPVELVSSDVTGPSVPQSEVSVQCSEDEDSERTSCDSLVEDQPRICASEQVPLPPPSVVLELLRSRQHPAAQMEICHSVPTFSDPASTIQTPAEPAALLLQRKADTDQPCVVPYRREGRGTGSSGLCADDHTLMNTMLRAIEEYSGHIEPPAAPCQSSTTSLPLSNDSAYEQQIPMNRVKVKPPVTRPSARLAFLQQMEPHELSAIQEVDTPVNISLDAEVSESNSVSLPAVVSDGSQSERSQVTGRISRMSWREALLMDSYTSSSSINQQLECDVDVACDSPSVDPDCLSSTTISTGSYSTSEPSITDTSLLHIKPVAVESSVLDPSPKSSSRQSQEIRDSIQKIIDKYTKDLDASLRNGSVHTDARGHTSSVSPSWSSIPKHDLSHDEDVCEHGRSAVDPFNGDFIPLQPHPDIDSSSSSSSTNLVRNDPSNRTQGWNKTANRIIEHFSDRLTVRHTGGPLTGDPSTSCKGQAQDSGFSHITEDDSFVRSVQQNSISYHNFTTPQLDQSNISRCSVTDQTASHGQSYGCESVLSQQIGRASDIGSSQVLDESCALAEGLILQQTPSTGGGGQSIGSERVCDAELSVHLSTSENINASTEATHDYTSDCFLSLPIEVTQNESMECSLADCNPLETETCQTNISPGPPYTSALNWLESTDATLPSFGLDTSLDQLRAETLNRSQSDLQISIERLSLTHHSLCGNDVMALPTATDVSSQKSSLSKICLQDESHELASQEVDLKAYSQHMSCEENTLNRLLDRVQEGGDAKGILEESTISFISLPESTLQDPDITGIEERTESVTEAEPENRPTKENETQGESNGKGSLPEGSSPSECPESASPHTVMIPEFQCLSAQQQEALLLRRHHLAQRSAARAAEVKAKSAMKTSRVVQNVSKCTSSPGCSVQKLEMVCRLKTVGEVKICTPEQRCVAETEMYQRTQRLYNRLEEVQQKKELCGRQKAYAKNREKAKEFQRKTLEKLRAKQ